MTNNQKTTEDLLQKGKGISLSETEHDEMKSTLLSYAKYHGVKEKIVSRRSWTSLVWVRTLSASALALVLFVGTGYASTDSLPGERLYAMKVNVVEEMVAATKFEPQDQLAYQVVLAERRLGEVHELSEVKALSPASVSLVEAELTKVVSDLGTLVGHDLTDSFNTESILRATNDIAATMQAVENIVGAASTTVTAATFHDVVDDAVAIHDSEIQEFTSFASDERVQQYIADRLGEISNELSEKNLATSTNVKTQMYIEEALENIESGNIRNASVLISDAILMIETDEYQHNFEAEIVEDEYLKTPEVNSAEEATPEPKPLETVGSTSEITN